VGKLSLNAAQPYAKAEGRVFLLVSVYPGCPLMMMMMMIMMDELTLTWHIVLSLQGHVTVKKSHIIVDALVDGTSPNSCTSERKARSSVYHKKLAVVTMPELTLTDCSKQTRQLPGRHGRRW